jgi:hypothetical protein
VVVPGDYTVGDYDIFFLFDFDETHVLGRCEALCLEGWVLVCDRDVIRGMINVGFDEGSTNRGEREWVRERARNTNVQGVSAKRAAAERLMKGAEAPWSAAIGLAEAQPHLHPWQTPCRSQA